MSVLGKLAYLAFATVCVGLVTIGAMEDDKERGGDTAGIALIVSAAFFAYLGRHIF